MIRIGTGFDSHRLEEGRKLILGGVEITHSRGLLGHSDADVIVHAIIDALFGSIADGDIGQHFPDTDPKWKGADSIELLKTAAGRLKSLGWKIVNTDATVIAQEPKLGPHIQKMRERIAEAMGVEKQQVSIKAKTNEGMGALGRREGIAVHAVALVEKEDEK